MKCGARRIKCDPGFGAVKAVERFGSRISGMSLSFALESEPEDDGSAGQAPVTAEVATVTLANWSPEPSSSQALDEGPTTAETKTEAKLRVARGKWAIRDFDRYPMYCKTRTDF